MFRAAVARRRRRGADGGADSQRPGRRALGTIVVPVRARRAVSVRSVAVDSASPIGGGGSSRVGRWLALRRFIRACGPTWSWPSSATSRCCAPSRAAGVGARVVFDQGTPLSEFLRDADYRWSRPWRSARVRRGDEDRLRGRGSRRDDVARRRRRPGAVLRRQAEHVRVVHNPVDLDGDRRGRRGSRSIRRTPPCGGRRSSSRRAVWPKSRTTRC